MTSLPLEIGLPKLPFCPGAGARPSPKFSPGAWSLGTEPSALEVRGGEMGRWGRDGELGRPEQCGQNFKT